MPIRIPATSSSNRPGGSGSWTSGWSAESDDRLREQLGRLLGGFLRRDPGRLADALLALGTSTGAVDRARLREDLANLLARYFGRSVSEVSLRSALGEILEIVRRHHLKVPPDLSLLFTVLIIAEGIVAELDPEFRFAEALAPYARRHLVSGMTAGDAVLRLEQFGVDVAELAVELPRASIASPRQSRPAGSRSMCAPRKWTLWSPAPSASVTASRRVSSLRR